MTIETPDQLAGLVGRRLIDVEFIYQPRPIDPSDPRLRALFDAAMVSRLTMLDPVQDALLLIVDSLATLESLQPLIQKFPDLLWGSQIANPAPWIDLPNVTPSVAPLQCNWPNPNRWQRFKQSDRWARLETAFELGSGLSPYSYLILPAHDALWGPGLLTLLLNKSAEYGHGGLPAAISPYSYYRHSAIDGIDIPLNMIALINVAFNRDTKFAERLNSGLTQGIWGKTALVPCAMCAAIRTRVDQTFFEDDAEIDRVIRDLGYAARGIWVADPKLYRQVLPVFDEAAARQIILRTLHYSLPAGGSALLMPLDEATRASYAQQPELWHANARAEAIINDCQLEIQRRLDTFGASWLDWGAYRYLVRVGDPQVEVWQFKR